MKLHRNVCYLLEHIYLICLSIRVVDQIVFIAQTAWLLSTNFRAGHYTKPALHSAGRVLPSCSHNAPIWEQPRRAAISLPAAGSAKSICCLGKRFAGAQKVLCLLLTESDSPTAQAAQASQHTEISPANRNLFTLPDSGTFRLATL